MSTVLLRKLTMKSQLRFGRFFDLTVQEMVQKFQYSYLRWVYFNCSNITFTDDILDILKIDNKYKIPKPGKNPGKDDELRLQIQTYLEENFPKIAEHNKKQINKRSKAAARSAIAKIAQSNNKFSLSQVNHGHIKHKTN